MQNTYDILDSLLTECRNVKSDSSNKSLDAFAYKVDYFGMWDMLQPIFKKGLRNTDPKLHPLPRIVAALAAFVDDYRLGLGKVVSESFFASTKSPIDLAEFRNAYNEISTWSPFRIHSDWIAQKTLYRASEIPGGLDEYLEIYESSDKYRGANRVSDLVYAAIRKQTGGEQGWSIAASNETRRSLIRAAFEDPRVSSYENPRFSAFSGTLAEIIDWGLRARDLEIITDDALWRFYTRYEAEAETCEDLHHIGAAREKRLRQWLLDRGSCRVTDALREACVGLALKASRKSV